MSNTKNIKLGAQVKGIFHTLGSIIIRFLSVLDSLSILMLIKTETKLVRALDDLEKSEDSAEIKISMEENIDRMRKSFKKTALIFAPFIIIITILIIIF